MKDVTNPPAHTRKGCVTFCVLPVPRVYTNYIRRAYYSQPSFIYYVPIMRFPDTRVPDNWGLTVLIVCILLCKWFLHSSKCIHRVHVYAFCTTSRVYQYYNNAYHFQKSRPNQVPQRREEDLVEEKPVQVKQVITQNSWAQNQANRVAPQNLLQLYPQQWMGHHSGNAILHSKGYFMSADCTTFTPVY